MSRCWEIQQTEESRSMSSQEARKSSREQLWSKPEGMAKIVLGQVESLYGENEESADHS